MLTVIKIFPRGGTFYPEAFVLVRESMEEAGLGKGGRGYPSKGEFLSRESTCSVELRKQGERSMM